MVRSLLSSRWHSTPTALDFPITVRVLSSAVRALGYGRLAHVASHVPGVALSPMRDTEKLLAVLDEQRGTCSSKHRFLRRWRMNAANHVKALLGLYECREEHSGVGESGAAGIDAIPERTATEVSGTRFDSRDLRPIYVSVRYVDQNVRSPRAKSLR